MAALGYNARKLAMREKNRTAREISDSFSLISVEPGVINGARRDPNRVPSQRPLGFSFARVHQSGGRLCLTG